MAVAHHSIPWSETIALRVVAVCLAVVAMLMAGCGAPGQGGVGPIGTGAGAPGGGNTGGDQVTDPGNPMGSVRVVNSVTVGPIQGTIWSFYLTPVVSPYWGNDRLGAQVLAPGQSFVIENVAPDMYDYYIRFSNNTAYAVYGNGAIQVTAGTQTTLEITNAIFQAAMKAGVGGDEPGDVDDDIDTGKKAPQEDA